MFLSSFFLPLPSLCSLLLKLDICLNRGSRSEETSESTNLKEKEISLSSVFNDQFNLGIEGEGSVL